MTWWLWVAIGYGLGVGSSVFAVWLGERLGRQAPGQMYDEDNREQMRRLYHQQAEALGPLLHVGADGAMHRGHVLGCTLCAKIKARQG